MAVVATVMSACHPAARDHGVGLDSVPIDRGYFSPPQVLRAEPTALGGLQLRGAGSPKATIRLQSPEGDSRSTKVRASGVWGLKLPVVVRPRMFALSEDVDGRVVHAEGAVIILPKPAPSVLMARAGFGALVVAPASPHPTLSTIDYDPEGFAAFSGLTQPHRTVRLSVDGAPAGLSQADAMGRYAVLAANHKLSLGRHSAAIQVGTDETLRTFQLTAFRPLTTPYQVVTSPDGWYVEWAAPGGGIQTTLVLAPQLSAPQP